MLGSDNVVLFANEISLVSIIRVRINLLSQGKVLRAELLIWSQNSKEQMQKSEKLKDLCTDYKTVDSSDLLNTAVLAKNVTKGSASVMEGSF